VAESYVAANGEMDVWIPRALTLKAWRIATYYAVCLDVIGCANVLFQNRPV
jgi:hypothetical protein